MHEFFEVILLIPTLRPITEIYILCAYVVKNSEPHRHIDLYTNKIIRAFVAIINSIKFYRR